MSRRPPSRSDDRGIASVLVLGVTVVVVLVTVVAVAAAQVVGARHAAAAAADLGALAGAGAGARGADGCAAAATIVRSNDARLITCSRDGADVLVTAAVTTAPLLGMRWESVVTARAGPAP